MVCMLRCRVSFFTLASFLFCFSAACPPGMQPEGVNCTACVVGTFKEEAGNASCTACPPGSYGQVAGSRSMWDCTACEAGSYQPDPGLSSCLQCAAGKFMPMHASSACWDCLANATSLPGAAFSWDCVCIPGFFMRDSWCRPCPRGLFKEGVGNEVCAACAAENEEAIAPDSAASCVCAPGYSNETGVCRAPMAAANDDGNEFAFESAGVRAHGSAVLLLTFGLLWFVVSLVY